MKLNNSHLIDKIGIFDFQNSMMTNLRCNFRYVLNYFIGTSLVFSDNTHFEVKQSLAMMESIETSTQDVWKESLETVQGGSNVR